MSVILVVEQDASYADRIVETLKQEGWDARRLEDRSAAIEAATSQTPRLVIASASQPEGTTLLRSFSRQEGGPGSVALIPFGVAEQATPADFQADEILAKPFSDDDLKQIVRRCLNTPPTSAPPKVAKKGRQLTSAEIFGDVLAEVEAEAMRAKAKRSSRPKKETSEDLDKKLEETLSGVLPIGGRLRRPDEVSRPAADRAPAAPKVAGKPRGDLPTDSEIDDLLDKTLSSLELPQRTRKAAKTSPDAVRPAEPEKVATPPAAVPFDPGPKPDPFSPVPDSLFPPLPAVPEPTVPESEAPASLASVELPERPIAPAESFGFEPTDTFDLGDSSPSVSRATEPTGGEPDPWQGIEPPPDLFPQSFAAPEAAETEEELLQPLEPLEDFPLSSEPAPSPATPAPNAAQEEDPFSFTDAFVPPPPEGFDDDAAQAGPLSFTDTFIPPDPKAGEDKDPGALYPPDHKESFPSYEPPPSSRARSFLEDSVAVATTPATTPAAAEPEPSSTGEETPAAIEEGQVFGDYTLLDKIATGGMAEVWRARRRGVEGFQKTVAIKKILGHLTDSPDFVNMFIDEAKLAAQLNHNNIIQIYDLGKEGDDFFIAMEHVDGKDLRSILSTGKKLGQPLPVGLALLIVASLARALDYAHRRRDFEDRPLGLVHRDVSPQNVLISYEGEIKLCDFGIVKAVSKASTTQMGALKGKLQYMSPEQAWGKKVDGRSDIFSVGSVLFEVLTGTKLFTGDNEISVLDAVRECKIRSPLELEPDLPAEIDTIVKKALTKAPEDRYQTAGDLEADLMSVLDTLRPTPSATDLATYLSSICKRQEPQFPTYEVSEEPQPSAEAEGEDEEKAVSAAKTDKGDSGDTGDKATKEGSGSMAKKALLVLLLLALLGALGFAAWKLTSGSEKTADRPTPTNQTPPPATPPAALAPGAATGEASSPGEPGAAPETNGADTGAVEAPGVSEEPAAGGDGENLDLQQLVEDGLAEQEERLQKRLEEEYEAKRRQLQEEISRAQQTFQEEEGEEEEASEAGAEPPPDSRR